MRKKKRISHKEVVSLATLRLRRSEDPYAAFQKEPLTSKSLFVRLIVKEDPGYAVHWIWSQDGAALCEFMEEVVLFRAFQDQYAFVSPDLLPKCRMPFVECLGMAFTKGLLGFEGGISPEKIVALSQGLDAFDGAKRSSIKKRNIASVTLMDFTSLFYHSLSWNFFDYTSMAKEVAPHFGLGQSPLSGASLSGLTSF
jgi:hypothetical protein